MNTQLRIRLFLLLALSSTTVASSQRMETLFYTIDNEQCFESFRAHVRSIDIVGPQCYRTDEHGNLWGSVDSRMMDLARANDVKVMPLVVNPGFDQPSFHRLLHDSLARARAIGSMVRICRENKFYGIQFDYENIHITDKDAYTAYYKEAAQALHASGFKISVAVVPRTSDDVGPNEYQKWIHEYWRGAYDYKALADAGDFISLMTYDEHTHRTTPGPVAGMPWMEAVIRFVLETVPPSKVSLGIPFYSRLWQPSYQNSMAYAWGKTLDYTEAIGIAERFRAVWKWDDKEHVSYTVYANSFLNEYIYLEDARSFEDRSALVSKYHLRGISVWRLGHEDPNVWRHITPLK
ncbi:MAG TPA: glycosyl hydrolase family 18 protein [Bacteroidota bacterium]|nr:glycosyl hydrolase family 18 protein [Bacteroidota bacterium]